MGDTNRRGALWVLALALGWLASGCTAPGETAAPAPSELVIANAGDGTVSRLLVPDGARAGGAMPVGAATDQIAPGPHGSVLVVTVEAEQRQRLLQLSPPADHQGRGEWDQRAIRLDMANSGAQDLLVAADGGRWAALAFRRAGTSAGRCALAVVDAEAGEAAAEHMVCGQDETVDALAVVNRGGDVLVYLAVGRVTGPGGEREGVPSGRLVVVEGGSGRVVASVPLAETPTALQVAADAEGELVLYCVAVQGGPEMDPPRPYEARLVILDAPTLSVRAAYGGITERPRLSVTPGGGRVYLLTGDVLTVLDPAGGGVHRLIRLPRRGLGMAATSEHVYVVGAYGDEVWVIDGATGVLVRSIRAGKGPVAVALRR